MRAMPPAYRLQCRRFLAELRRTGNVKLSAERAGVPKQTLQNRRRAHAGFAAEWTAALAFARAALARGGPTPPVAKTLKTEGGEYTVRKGRGGEWQVRRAHPGELTPAGEQLFLETLAATANIDLACRTVGVFDSTIYIRRERSVQFADRMDAALAHGHERLGWAVLEAAIGSLSPEELTAGWLEGAAAAPSPLTRMTFDQVMQVLGMHMKRVVLERKRPAHNRHVTTAEETDAAITRLLDNLNKRKVALAKVDWETGEARAAVADAPVAVGQTRKIEGRGEDAGVPDPAVASARIRVMGRA